jgi:16S rRNA processing protein RimM
LVGGHGVRGLAKAHPFNPGSPGLLAAEKITLVRPDGNTSATFAVLESRPHKNIILMRMDGLESLNALEPWIGSEIHLDREHLPAAGETGVYHWEALGLEVRTRQGILVGHIEEIQSMPANDLWVVRDGARESLIPVVEPIVVEIDLPAGVAIIDPPAGLVAEE